MSDTASLGFGKRSIGFIGGVCLLLNNCLGPAFAKFPDHFQTLGWFPCIAALVIFGATTLIGGWMLLYAQSRVPIHLPRMEYSGLCKYYFNKPMFMVSNIFYVATLICLCVAGILQIAHLMDLVLAHSPLKKSCAINLYPVNQLSDLWVCKGVSAAGYSVFDSGTKIISAGYVIAAVFAVPFGFFPLDDNIKFQVISCALMFVCAFVWIVLFAQNKETDIEPYKSSAGYGSIASLVGASIFNYSVAFSLPSWNNERKEKISVFWSLLTAVLISAFMTVSINWLAGRHFEESNFLHGADLIDVIFGSKSLLSIACVLLFSLANNVTSVPVFSVCIRYNLMETKVCNKKWATILSIAVPWIIAIFFSTGDAAENFIEITGMLFSSVPSFLAPPLLFLCALKQDRTAVKSAEIKNQRTSDIEVNIPVGEEIKSSDVNVHVEEHPSRSNSIEANLQFKTIRKQKTMKMAQVVAFAVFAILLIAIVPSLIFSIKDALKPAS